jgi:hypothetical protein
MPLRRFAAAVSTVVLIALLGGANGEVGQAAGGARAGPDLSTPEAAKAYLVSQGFDPSKFIFQVGLKNYAGPSCPGLGWNCTGANLVVQIATAGGENYAACAEGVRQCVIVQGSSAGLAAPLKATGEDDVNMHGRCTPPPEGANMRLKDSGTLTCTITQDNPTTGNNHAVASMSIHDNDSPTQRAQEDAVVTQTTHGDGDNHAVVHEEIVLYTTDGSTQMQDGFQSLKLMQDVVPLVEDTDVIPATGDNFGNVKQTQNITARARSDDSVQLQQTTERVGGDPCISAAFVPATDTNSCVEFHQTTGTGRNDLNVHQDHNVEAVASGTGADQTQGCTSKVCGLEMTGSQEPFGSTNNVDNHQSITYTLRGPDDATQLQDPPIRNQGGSQMGSTEDLWKVGQVAVLMASNPDAMQAHINEVSDTSTGTVDAQSVIIIDGKRSEIVCNASSCSYVQACGDVPGETEIELFCPEFMDVTPTPGPTFTGVTRID